jgi:hypothetical protein
MAARQFTSPAEPAIVSAPGSSRKQAGIATWRDTSMLSLAGPELAGAALTRRYRLENANS